MIEEATPLLWMPSVDSPGGPEECRRNLRLRLLRNDSGPHSFTPHARVLTPDATARHTGYPFDSFTRVRGSDGGLYFGAAVFDATRL